MPYFSGDPAAVDVDGAEGIAADADQKLTIGGLGDVEAIEQGDRLVGLASCNMGLPELILDHTGNEIEDIAIIARRRIGDIDDIEAGDLFLRNGERRIDHRSGFGDIDDFPDFLLVKQSRIDVAVRPELQRRNQQRVKANLLYAQLISSRRDVRQAATAAEIGFAVKFRGLGTHVQRNSGGGDYDSVFVGYGDLDSLGNGFRELAEGETKTGSVEKDKNSRNVRR